MPLCRRCYIRRPFQPPAALALSATQRLPEPPRPDARNPRLSWRGLHGSARALAIAQAAAADERLLLVVAADARALDDLARELRFFAPADLPLLQLPDWEVLPYDLFSPHPDIISERLATLAQLPLARRGILLLTAETLLLRLPPREFIQGRSFSLRTGQAFNLEQVRTQLTQAGYYPVGQVTAPGEYALRGSLFDVFPMGTPAPLRIDLFDDEIESIRHFDPESQRSLEKIDSFQLLPAREVPLDDESLKNFRRRYRTRFEGEPSRSNLYRAVSEGRAAPGIEFYLPLFYEHTATLFDYLPAHLLVVIEPALTAALEGVWNGIVTRHEDRRQALDPAAILRDLQDLSAGAPVVHEEYGVGRYVGLQVMEINEQPGEFLVIEYHGGDRIYVPVAALHLVSRYTGAAPESAPLHRLGTDQWAKARKRATEKIRDVAAELLDLYAQRQARRGLSLVADERDYQAFANAFPFEETPDQAEAINKVLADMASERPMDRNVCGDVGFGKTEVAVRAAFVAVQAGKQVAVLVPTTLLAEQHTNTFRDRFADLAVRIESLSRFRAGKESRATLDALTDGKVDIVIATHRLLHADARFKDLGLLIIDEEHRFGVRDKERLKAMRAEVHVLTLTATPIPRTLNMALGGLRELSLITTPPPSRIAIKTFVTEWDGPAIREAAMRELRRGGQIYFVHNEVQSIEKIAEDLRQLIPEASVRVGHGQMRERDLEQLMIDFYHRRFDILLCTTIIESGIDVPTANTIMINRADRLGLAQLHQLRGRVGRSHHRAYAYLIVPSRRGLTADAARRLEAIEALEELGAGFVLATHDLEIRGAGEFLGESQSGELTEIGLTMYLDMLERAVTALMEGRDIDLNRPLAAATEVNLHLPALLPDDYIGDVHMRLTLYKRIAAADSSTALDDLQSEVIDRFGPLPPAAVTLLRIARLTLTARAAGIRRFDVGQQSSYVVFEADHRIDPQQLIRLIQKEPRIYKLEGALKLRISLGGDPDDRADIAHALLARLTSPAAPAPVRR